MPMQKESEVLLAIKLFVKEIGVLEAIITNASSAKTSQAVHRFFILIGTTLKTLEEGTPQANLAQLHTGLLKSSVSKDLKESNCLLSLWDYCTKRCTRINNLTSKDSFKLQGSNPFIVTIEEMEDISNLYQFGWYE